jgi:membrane-associated protease RseP (regulator of RpoE activity)
MDFLIIGDLIFLAIFAIFIARFLYNNKKKVKKEGILLLYKAGWGIKLINYVGGRYKKTLDVLSYVAIAVGYVLMGTMVYLFGRLIWLYVLNPDLVRAIKIPPIMPLIPYLPKLFNLDFLPPFYFTYWILILAVVAITHEFAHGIFMKRYGIKIKSTGFGFFPSFFPVFLAAFVEQDEKSMLKAKKLKQMAVLAAGTFANVLTGLLFFVITLIFFSAAFTPVGVQFNDYSYSVVNVTDINSINNVPLTNPTMDELSSLAENSSYNYIQANGKEYVGIKAFLGDSSYIALYDSAPAINNKIIGAIIQINGVSITSLGTLSEELEKYSPGETINILTKTQNDSFSYEVALEEHPLVEGQSWIGVNFLNPPKTGVVDTVISKLSSFKDPNVYYESKMGEFGGFIYDLLWWMILISFSVALVNMLPVGIFDGGRFFHLTIWGLTKREKIADKTFLAVTWIFMMAIVALMFFWAKAFF